MYPFVKWAGGKRQLIDILIKMVPKNYNRYIEPFVGGGALLFALQDKHAIINDINKSLINAYTCIRDYPIYFIKKISEYDEILTGKGVSYYNKIRDDYNKKLQTGVYDIETSAMFVFLNKHCFNGLYRVNQKGFFNVPFNNKMNSSIDSTNIQDISEYLQGVEIYCDDFEVICDKASYGDFVFIDSPYDKSFNTYTENGFGEVDHRRLAEVFRKLTEAGVYIYILTTNHNTSLINSLYEGFNKVIVPVRRSINSDKNCRTGEEIIITNYKEDE